MKPMRTHQQASYSTRMKPVPGRRQQSGRERKRVLRCSRQSQTGTRYSHCALTVSSDNAKNMVCCSTGWCLALHTWSPLITFQHKPMSTRAAAKDPQIVDDNRKHMLVMKSPWVLFVFVHGRVQKACYSVALSKPKRSAIPCVITRSKLLSILSTKNSATKIDMVVSLLRSLSFFVYATSLTRTLFLEHSARGHILSRRVFTVLAIVQIERDESTLNLRVPSLKVDICDMRRLRRTT